MKFWDSSAVIPLLVQEAESASIDAFFREDPQIVTWWATAVECASAIARREREELFESAAVGKALGRLTRLRAGWQEIQPGDALRELAVRLLRVHFLRAADSLQLAAAIFASENHPASLDFVCLDKRLSLAAQREGFNVIAL